MDNQKPSPKLVGQLIRSIRQSKGLSMDEFGNLIDGKARSGAVANWETGKNLPNNKRLKKIADIGDVTVDFLLGSDFKPLNQLTLEEKEVVDHLQMVQLNDFLQTSNDNTNKYIHYLYNKEKNVYERYLINNFIHFNDLYNNPKDKIKSSVLSMLIDLNRLHIELNDSEKTKEEKESCFQFYHNDLQNINEALLAKLKDYFE